MGKGTRHRWGEKAHICGIMPPTYPNISERTLAFTQSHVSTSEKSYFSALWLFYRPHFCSNTLSVYSTTMFF